MDAEQDYRLLTFSCGCAAAAQIRGEETIAAEPFEFGRHRIVEHRSMRRGCDDARCIGKLNPGSRKMVMHRLGRQILCQFRDSAVKYTKLGQRYHSCLLRTRAKLANSAACALAHEQFAISDVPRGEDPFFKLDEEAKESILNARTGVLESDEEEDIDVSMELTHEALFLCCRKANAMLSLRLGVEAIVAAERASAGGVLIPKDVQASVSPPRPSSDAVKPAYGEIMCVKGQLPVEVLSSFTLPYMSDSPVPPTPAFLATNKGFVEPVVQNLARNKPKMQRNAQYTWPAYRWTLYRPRGLQAKDPSPIQFRKLNLQAGNRRNVERERLFQKMIYGKWMKRVSGPRDLSGEDMYAIWPET